MLSARPLSRMGRRGLVTATSTSSSFRGLATPSTSPIITSTSPTTTSPSTTTTSASSRGLLTSAASPSWFKTRGELSKEETENKAFSAVLGKDQYVYRIVTDHVIPSQWEAYVANKKLKVAMMIENEDIKGEHVASWRTIVGDSKYKAIHLYRYYDGWKDIDGDRAAKKACKEFSQLSKVGDATITNQTNELAKAFMFWPEPDKRSGSPPHVYDIRTYHLRPGSLFDWSNYWSRGIQLRGSVRSDVPYCGLFTQLGQLHTIYHVWCYSSMADRKACREATWHYPGWNDIVANTVPLVNTMSTRILEPMEFSPTQ